MCAAGQSSQDEKLTLWQRGAEGEKMTPRAMYSTVIIIWMNREQE